MNNIITIKIKDNKAKKVIQSLEEIKFIQIVNDPTLGLKGKKKKQAKDFLSALRQAKLAAEGKIKLRTAESLINEL